MLVFKYMKFALPTRFSRLSSLWFSFSFGFGVLMLPGLGSAEAVGSRVAVDVDELFPALFSGGVLWLLRMW